MIKYLFVGSLLMMLLILGGCGEDSPIAPAIEDIVAAAPGKPDTRLPLKIYYFDMERKPSTRPGGAVYAGYRRQITELTVQAHRWFASQMRQHGRGGMSFKLPRREADGQLPITYLRASHPQAYYSGENDGRVKEEVDARFGDFSGGIQGIRLVFMNGRNGHGRTACGFGQNGDVVVEREGHRVRQTLGYAYVSLSPECGWIRAGKEEMVVRHELGHAFGLSHDWRDGDYIMSYGKGSATPWTRLSLGAARWLSRHPAFKSQRGARLGRLENWLSAMRISAVPIPNSRKHIVTITGDTFWLGAIPKGDIPSPFGVLWQKSPNDSLKGPEVIRFIDPKHFTFSVHETTTRQLADGYPGGFTTGTDLTFTVKFPVILPEALAVSFITDEGLTGGTGLIWLETNRFGVLTRKGKTLEWARKDPFGRD